MIQTVLAFDYGTQSIGVAYGQSLTNKAKELPPLKANDGVPDWNTVATLLQEWQPHRLIVGLPLNMDGSESDLCARARKYGRRLHGRFNLPVEWMDERLSTFDAKQEARERGHKGNYQQDPIDSIAARLILEIWFQQNTAR